MALREDHAMGFRAIARQYQTATRRRQTRCFRITT